MEKILFEIFNYLALFGIVTIPALKLRSLWKTGLSLIVLLAAIASGISISVFLNGASGWEYTGSIITGPIRLNADYLSAWFMLIISFTFVTGAFYGVKYLERYKSKLPELRFHLAGYILIYAALINLCVLQNALVFLLAWEIMALSAFLVIIFEWEKKETLSAGINFLIQSHICILLLTLGFIWVKVKTGSYDFEAITGYTAQHPGIGTALFILFFTGFAIKAGFVPFHTWLPLAHPAAPAHISGVMSGVIIKIGIFGILRMVTFIHADYALIGYLVLGVSALTGIYGVMLAIVQHNLKRLLAYHSIENIGIIGIGIGLGCLGIGLNNQPMFILGFGGALLHTLNHSLFKSLLFYGAGNVYQATHSMNIESMGGLIKRMPQTASLFLVAAMAICGLPPFNGFVSEFLIYKGLFGGLQSGDFIPTLAMLFSILSLVLIGGLALICFTKAFGVVFLGTNRGGLHVEEIEKPMNTFPLYAVAFLMLVIGVFPFLFSGTLLKITSTLVGAEIFNETFSLGSVFHSIGRVGKISFITIMLVVVLFVIRNLITGRKIQKEYETWGCGYTGEIPKAQYTASSYIRTYRKLAEPVLMIEKHKELPDGLYPQKTEHATHPYDKLEAWLIDWPLKGYRYLLNRFAFLQNGNIQYYILYGLIFVSAVFVFPILLEKIIDLIHFFNQV